MKIKQLQVFLIVSLSLFLMSACTHLKDQWPEQVPSRSHFTNSFDQDELNKTVQTKEEYLLWIQRFYLGWEIYKRGWLKMTNELLAEVDDPKQQKIIERKMSDLGLKISREWAKKSKKRRIYTRHVAIWGNALLESLDKGESMQLINQVNDDVDALLEHRLDPKMITENRYYPQDDNNPFL
ncbi:MAG: hypothetical protein IPK77_00965 [Cellvibrio sp.]|nr:hypothetical protein [Cellvibrio sp.]